MNVGTNKSNWGEHKNKENEIGLNFWRTKIVVFWNYVVNWQQFLRKIGWFNRVGFRKVTEQYNENTLQQWKWKYIIFIRKLLQQQWTAFFHSIFNFCDGGVVVSCNNIKKKTHEEIEEKTTMGNNNMLTYNERESYFPSRLIQLSSSPILWYNSTNSIHLK